jgi:meiotically up-regulated gene 157 (Mug157) protein
MARSALPVLATILIAAMFTAATAPSAQAVTVLTAYAGTLRDHALPETDGTTYVITGDIHAEWLRDASAVARSYVEAAKADPATAQTLRGIAAREARYIMIDPYANAFTAAYRVFERKFELCSLLYPIWFAYSYWKATGDATIFTDDEQTAFESILRVMHVEQHHFALSHYRHPELTDHGRGSPVAYTGMVWTGFRPSDDAARYHFNIPDNMLAVVVLHDLADVERVVYHDETEALSAEDLAMQIDAGIKRFGLVDVPGAGRMYAYEVDGLGHVNLMDDANVPSLLSIPYLGYLPVTDTTYQTTRRFVLSNRNPYYFSGTYASGVGSPHTPHGYVWPMALVMQAMTSTDQSEIERVLGYLAASDTGDHRLHESFDPNAPKTFTRADFAWPNALYKELLSGIVAKEAGATASHEDAVTPPE